MKRRDEGHILVEMVNQMCYTVQTIHRKQGRMHEKERVFERRMDDFGLGVHSVVLQAVELDVLRADGMCIDRWK